MPNAQLLIFAGSTRQQSFNRKLAHATAAIARDAGPASRCWSCLTLTSRSTTLTSKPRAHRPMWCASKGAVRPPAWIICSPEYNGSYTALLKNTIDWASSPVKGHPEWQDGTAPSRRQGGGHAQRVAWRPGRPAFAKPPGAPCSPTWNAGWRPRRLPWPRQAAPLTNQAPWCSKPTATACAPWWTRCCGRLNACKHQPREHFKPKQALALIQQAPAAIKIIAMNCRPGCGACCIALPFPPHSEDAPRQAGGRAVRAPHAQPGVRSVRQPERPAVCGSLQPSAEMCGASREHALFWLDRLDAVDASRLKPCGQNRFSDTNEPLTTSNPAVRGVIYRGTSTLRTRNINSQFKIRQFVHFSYFAYTNDRLRPLHEF